eukprot:jgi/Tetstr1/466925/TSEL_011379.t1
MVPSCRALTAATGLLGGLAAVFIGVKAGQGVEALAGSLWRRLRRARAIRRCRAAMAMRLRDVHAIRDEMAEQAKASLAGSADSTMPMLPTFVERLPRGSESGDYFALDLGGTNLHMMYVRLTPSTGSDGIDSTADEVAIERNLLSEPVEKLFEFIAEKGIAFMQRFLDTSAETPAVGFTFSFPMEQTGLAEGKLLRWTKGFGCPDGVGADPVALLKEAFRRKGVEVKVPALVNDTIGLLAAAKYYHPNCRLAVILGTGTNAAYMESQANVAKLGAKAVPSRNMAINTEWSDFTTRRVALLPEDKALDAASLNPGMQMFEKLMSGRNIGEVARRVLLSLARRGLLWSGGRCPFELRVPFSLPTWAVSRIDDSDKPLATAAEVLEKLGLLRSTGGAALSRAELAAVVAVCHAAGRRAARISAAGILAMLRLMEIDGSKGSAPSFTVAVDGSLYEKYTGFRTQLGEALQEVLGREAFDRIQMVHVEDGSGVGAALLVATCSQS